MLTSVILAPMDLCARQYILFNTQPASREQAFNEVSRRFPGGPTNILHVGVGGIFSYLAHPRNEVVAALTNFLQTSEQKSVPVVVQLDGENWWGGRPDLWNWWDESRPGFSLSNRLNVEWTGWSESNAVKIAWRNWGRQLRVLPPPNLMAARYRHACHDEMKVLVPIIMQWWNHLPEQKKHLFVGVKVGWETSIGVNAWYYPEGNTLADKPHSDDPVTGLNPDELPGRGVTPIGYAAVKTAGIRCGGSITEADLAEVARRHLEDLCRLAAELGIPRSKLFTHAGGWKENELLYRSAVNQFSCPGWSFYKHSANPAGDTGVQEALRSTDAPLWGAVEWLFQGPREAEPWRKALAATLTDRRCRYLCIYNWDGVAASEEVLKAVGLVVSEENSKP